MASVCSNLNSKAASSLNGRLSFEKFKTNLPLLEEVTKNEMKNIFLLSLILFILSNAVYSDPLLNKPSIFDQISLYEQNNYYKEKLLSYNPEFLKKWQIKEQEYSLVGITGGTHLGVLYIFPASKDLIHRLEIGPIHTILTKNELPILNEDEILVISASGGTGEHHIFGCFIKMMADKPKIISTFPISGGSFQGGLLLSHEMIEKGGDLNFQYSILSQQFLQDKAILKIGYIAQFKNISLEEQKKILKDCELNTTEEVFNVIIDSKRFVGLEGAKGIKKNLDWVLNYHKELNMTTFVTRTFK